MALCLHLAARGQTGYEYDYWFDNDRSTLHSGSSESGSWQLQADLTGLHDAIHAIHLQVRNAEGEVSSPITRYFVKTVTSQEAVGRYWFDDDVSHMHNAAHFQGVFDIDVSNIDEGFHALHYQVIGANGTVSSTATRTFYKAYIPSMSSWHCWFDNDYATLQTGTDMSNTLLLDVTGLRDGYHALHIQVNGGAGAVSTPITKPFVKIPQTEGVDYVTCLCSIDDQLFKQERVSAQGGVVSWNFDVSSLPQGFHRLFITVVTPSGAASAAYQSFFMRATTHAEFNQMKCVYAIDGAEFYNEAGTLANGTYHFDIDVSSLEDGLHRISYMLSNGAGVSTRAQTQFFMKTPLGGNGITEYRYWLNEQSDAQAKKVVLPERQDPFSLITLLPVESQPIRSKLFQFRIKDDQPVIYAKNDIHIRFYDAAGRFTDVNKQYVDESVSEEVTTAGVLQASQSFDRVEENKIRWYSFASADGDTIAFKASQACSIQVFSPSGEEIYSASGPESVEWGGCHTWEDGEYYLALHDVTGSQSYMTLDYMHMDQYDVVAQDVSVVGNGGCSTITFSGNGFRDLYAVDLYNAQGDTIHRIDIGHESDATTSVTFDFTGAALGQYDALFHFTEEDKVFTNIITVEEAKDIELATDVSFPATFLRGTSTTYTIKITNKGNMTAYRIPLDIQVATTSIDAITKVKFSDNVPKLKIDWMDTQMVSEEDIESVRAFMEEKEDLLHFITTYDSINNRYVKVCLLAIDIAPKYTYIINLNIASNESVNVQARIPSVWKSYSFGDMENTSQYIRNRAVKETMCCYREKVECVMNILVGAADFASFFVGPEGKLATCIADLGNTMLQFSYDVWCGEEHGGKDMRKAGEDLIWDAVNGLIGCATNIPGLEKLSNLDWIYQHIYNNIKTTMDCVSALSQQIPNCPPDDPHGGTSTPQPPADPNDIYGYLSDAGSKFMTDEVAKVNYTIEFENDTAFAQASAHTIVIRDTLDSRYFDLKSFLPTIVKIGEREAFLDEAADVKTAGGVTKFLKTIDMRPEIYAIAQVEGEYSQQTGIAKWTFTSLDPMTMEPTDDLMQGILPVNYNGTSGIGEVMFEIGVKSGKADGTEIPNRAGIVFDYEEPILTPTWVNTVDAVAPTSQVIACELKNDTTATLYFEGLDEKSGVWKYDVYVQYEDNTSWFKCAEGVTDSKCDVAIKYGINHGFYVVATDSAGNREWKEPAREYTLDIFDNMEDSYLDIELAQGWNWISHNLNLGIDVPRIDKAYRIVSQTEELMKDKVFGLVGNLKKLKAGTGYKIQMEGAGELELEGKLFLAEYKSIQLSKGWNWIGYPLAHEMEIEKALAMYAPEEGDYIVGQDGFTQYTEGQWAGTLTTLAPGKGYLYKSGSDTQLYFNANATMSARSEAKSRKAMTSVDWTYDKYKYPNIMPITACIYKDGDQMKVDDYYIGAFCGTECRGIGKVVKGTMMISVYGEGGETITFMAMEKDSEQLFNIVESTSFAADVLGSINQPYQLNIGNATSIDVLPVLTTGNGEIYDASGRKVNGSQKGINIIDGQKVMVK